MEQTSKELLLKELCGRLPYGIKCSFDNKVFSIDYISAIYEEIKLDSRDDYTLIISDVKPYLLPLSSMTEEQKKEYEDALVYHDYIDGGWAIAKLPNDEYFIPSWFVDFCNKNHFDYRGLIPMGLAKDATGLNIY